MAKQHSSGKALLVIIFVLFLAGTLALAILASHSRVAPAPAIHLNPDPVAPADAPDFRALTDISERKQAFFDFMRPLVQHQNAFYRQERERLKAIAAKVDLGQALSLGDRRKLAYWTRKLRLDEDLTTQEKIEVLQRRLQVIPEAMVLAQAAAESAWGQSRFARDASNYFGQWCYSEGCGLVPKRRSAGARHEVRSFDSALDSVRAYFRNINTHRAYRPLRDARLALEEAGEPITGYQLVGQLGRYSQRGQAYIDELRSIIRGNNLED